MASFVGSIHQHNQQHRPLEGSFHWAHLALVGMLPAPCRTHSFHISVWGRGGLSCGFFLERFLFRIQRKASALYFPVELHGVERGWFEAWRGPFHDTFARCSRSKKVAPEGKRPERSSSPRSRTYLLVGSPLSLPRSLSAHPRSVSQQRMSE